MTILPMEEGRPKYCHGCCGNLLVLSDVIEPKEHSQSVNFSHNKSDTKKGLIKLSSKL